MDAVEILYLDEGLRIYSIELMDKEKLGETFSASATGNPKSTTRPSFDEIIDRLKNLSTVAKMQRLPRLPGTTGQVHAGYG